MEQLKRSENDILVIRVCREAIWDVVEFMQFSLVNFDLLFNVVVEVVDSIHFYEGKKKVKQKECDSDPKEVELDADFCHWSNDA